MSGKVLVVDDEPQLVKALEVRLKSKGYEVIVAFDGEDALEKAKNDDPDLILLDLMLPKVEGFKVSRLLKFDDRYKHIPIIMLTAKADEASRIMGEETGADEYITKPFEWEYLLMKVGKHIRGPEED